MKCELKIDFLFWTKMIIIYLQLLKIYSLIWK